MMDWNAIIGLAGILSGATIGYLGHRRSKKVDATSAQSGAASNHRAGTQQVIEGLNSLIDQLQEENVTLRNQAESRLTRLEAMTLEVARLRKLYGANGDPPTKGT